LKILLLIRSLNIGGAERQLVILAKGLQQKGHEVSVAVFYAGGALERELHRDGIRVIDLHKTGRWGVLSFFRLLVKVIRVDRFETVYGFLNTANILTICLKPFFPKVRMVMGERASNVDFGQYGLLHILSYRIECWLSRFANLIICNSNAGLDFAAKNGFPGERLIIIPNGIDTVRFKPDAEARKKVRQEWGIAESEILIGLAARIDPMKDHATFLRAAALLAKKRVDVRFVCVGDDSAPSASSLNQLARELGLEGCLIWAGLRHDMPSVYCAFDIAVSSSITEGFSNTIAEAMSCGVPCVVTDVGDSAWIVGDSGIVVGKGNPESLYAGLLNMIERESNSGKEARSSIEERFSINTMIDRTEELLYP